jgi:uncharacterized damage-inducible protein DinB/predicted RNase H-like HicB family nuclease
MTPYKLYLESGPRHKKTMVHVLDLLGCIANGPTTEGALNRTPDAIQDFLQFLQYHGEKIEQNSEIQIEIAEHITEGIWLGNGDPSIVFQPDLVPLSVEELDAYIQRLEWMRLDMEALVGGLSEEQLEQKPQVKGRPIQAILAHILESEYAYMYAFGRLEELPGSGSIVKKREGELLDWMGVVRAREIERLRSLNELERSEPFIHWKYTRTARKVMRRMLEHYWEHLVEIKTRLERDE